MPMMAPKIDNTINTPKAGASLQRSRHFMSYFLFSSFPLFLLFDISLPSGVVFIKTLLHVVGHPVEEAWLGIHIWAGVVAICLPSGVVFVKTALHVFGHAVEKAWLWLFCPKVICERGR
jgi:hypothetical protein|nr:hypothetical protein [Halomonas sp. UBA3074]|tara:strand:- start:5347 stop:5703 length:357 start_codon:yes stop_codon:yes gene_type:complete